MSQHNIIGSEAFGGRPYIIVRKVRVGIGRRRRRNAVLTITVAIIALIVGALVAVFALAPLLMDRDHAIASAAARPAAGAVVTEATPLETSATTTSATGGPSVAPAS